MPRILGVDLPGEKRTDVALRYLYGIGRTLARRITAATGVDPGKRAKDLTDEELTRLSTHIEKNYTTEGQLRRQIAQSIQRLKDIGCYRGIRHRRGLPARGQRTRTNARTRKGPRKTVAGKKGVKEMARG